MVAVPWRIIQLDIGCTVQATLQTLSSPLEIGADAEAVLYMEHDGLTNRVQICLNGLRVDLNCWLTESSPYIVSSQFILMADILYMMHVMRFYDQHLLILKDMLVYVIIVSNMSGPLAFHTSDSKMPLAPQWFDQDSFHSRS